MKRSFVSVLGSAGLVAGLMAGAPVVMAEESSTVLRTPSPVTIAAAPTSNGAWTEIDATFNNSVNALELTGNDLYIGGSFTTPHSRIAKFDTQNQVLGALSTGISSGAVDALLADSVGNLYVGGTFNQVAGDDTKVTTWNGNSFQGLTGIRYLNSDTRFGVNSFSLSSSGDQLVFGVDGFGNAADANGTPILNTGSLLVYDLSTDTGSSIYNSGQDPNGALAVLVGPSDDTLYVGSQAYSTPNDPRTPISYTLGQGPQNFETIGPNTCSSLCTVKAWSALGDDTVVFGGAFESTRFGVPGTNLIAVYTPGTGAISAPGEALSTINAADVYALHWDADNHLLYAGGKFTETNAPRNLRLNNVAVLDQRTGKWAPLRTGSASSGWGVGGGIAKSIQASGKDVYVGGDFTTPVSRLGKWSWSLPSAGSPLPSLSASENVPFTIAGQGFIGMADDSVYIKKANSSDDTALVIDYVATTDDSLHITIPTGAAPTGAYELWVSAVGGTAKIADLNVVTLTAPAAPTDVSVVPGITTADVSWTITDDGNSPLTEIQFAIDDTTTYPAGLDDSTTTTTSPYELTGLTTNTTYTVYVRAVNAIGSSEWSEGVTFTPSKNPSTPRITGLAPGDDTVSVSWVVDDTKGFSLTRIEFAIDDTSVVDDSTTTTTSPSLVAQGLTNDDSSIIYVRAVTLDGATEQFSEWSLASPAFTPSASVMPVTGLVVLDVDDTRTGNPSAQTGFTAVVSIPQQAAPFAPPFTITAERTGTQSLVDAPSCEVTTNGGRCTLSGDVNPDTLGGATFRFTVAPTINGGLGPQSAPSSDVQIAEPGTVTVNDVTVTAADRKAAITIDSAPTFGGPVATYTAVAFIWSSGNPAGQCVINVPQSACDITGLTPGAEYGFSVRTANSIAQGGLMNPAVGPVTIPGGSDPTPPAPPLPSKPSAPGSVTLDPGRGSIAVSWTPATAPADAPVILYRATAIPGGASCQAAATATSCDITGLRNGTAYTVFVTAINAGGQGPAAQAGPVTPSGEAPARPGRPQVTAGNGQVNVTFVPGSGGGDAGSYTATASPGGATCTVAAPDVTCAITGLTNGTAYTVTATATNGAGTSPVSPASASVTPNGDLPEAPATPGRPTAVAGDSSATVTVTPGSGGGQADTFTVTANPGGASCTITSPDTSCEVTGLTNGTAYSFTAVATNAGGSSDPSAASAQVTPQVEAPAPPASVQVLVGDGQATIIATPSEEGGPTERFVVISSPGAKACVITLPATSCVIDGLTNGVAYTFSVRSVNAGGSAPAPSPTTPVTPEPAIDPTPVPLVNPPAAGESQAVEDGNPVTDLQVEPDRTGTGLSVTSSNFTLDVEGVDRRGNPVGLQNDQVLLLVDDGRARTAGTGFRPGSVVNVFLEVPVIGNGSMLRIGAAAAMDLGQLSVDSVGEFVGTVDLPADLAAGDYVLQVAGVTQGNGERAVSLGVRVVDNNASITLVKGKRVNAKGRTDRIRATGTSEGIPAGTKLVPYFRLGKKGDFKQGVATIVVQEDGSFTWTRKVTRSRLLQAYVAFASAESNTVTWRRIR